MNQQQTDELYIKIAEAMASNSKAERLKVGAVLIKDDHIIAAGYNGTPRGTDNACEDENGNTYPWVVHAEENVLIQAARSTNSTVGSTLYITHCRVSLVPSLSFRLASPGLCIKTTTVKGV